MESVEILLVQYAEKWELIHQIREEVFQIEQGVDENLEFDGNDQTADHLLAYLQDQAVGTARIRYLADDLAKIERLAVLKIARKQGIGIKLMEKALQVASEKGRKIAMIHAQEYVRSLHEKLGFQPVGERFYEAGIPHIKMKKQLP